MPIEMWSAVSNAVSKLKTQELEVPRALYQLVNTNPALQEKEKSLAEENNEKLNDNDKTNGKPMIKSILTINPLTKTNKLQRKPTFSFSQSNVCLVAGNEATITDETKRSNDASDIQALKEVCQTMRDAVATIAGSSAGVVKTLKEILEETRSRREQEKAEMESFRRSMLGYAQKFNNALEELNTKIREVDYNE